MMMWSIVIALPLLFSWTAFRAFKALQWRAVAQWHSDTLT